MVCTARVEPMIIGDGCTHSIPQTNKNVSEMMMDHLIPQIKHPINGE